MSLDYLDCKNLWNGNKMTSTFVDFDKKKSIIDNS